MSFMSIQELDAIWNKYYAEYNRTPADFRQLMAFAKASGTPIKFVDGTKNKYILYIIYNINIIYHILLYIKSQKVF